MRLAAVKLKSYLHVYIFKKRQDFHYIEIRDNQKYYVLYNFTYVCASYTEAKQGLIFFNYYQVVLILAASQPGYEIELLIVMFKISKKLNGLILPYCLIINKSYSCVSRAQDHKMQQGKILDYWKSYARDNRLICARVYKMSARFGTSMSA